MPEDQPHSTANSTGGWQYKVYSGPGWEKLVQGDQLCAGQWPQLRSKSPVEMDIFSWLLQVIEQQQKLKVTQVCGLLN